ncbi:MAG TPA: hypothetical protein VK688_04610, partial [Gemmatimonadales bacterium]|nr:hypothetical protein [Gemmatimonadales bacterium]
MRAAALAALLVLAAAPVRGQTPGDSISLPADSLDPESPDQFVTATAGARYGAGWLHRMLFGADHRALWTTPIEVKVLDLRTYAGGLRPVRRGGHSETASLHLEASDGRKFDFRSVDKDPSQVLRPELRGTVLGWIARDQVSAEYPTGALVAAPLLEAAGVANAPPTLFVMPDDSALGEFRQQFAGMLGLLEERPSEASGEDPSDASQEHPGLAGVRKVADTDELFERLDRDPEHRVDTRAYLAARLMDDFLGDWDRHEGQWRWIKPEKGRTTPWEPIPYDRDQAFSHYGGFLAGLGRLEEPDAVFVKFGDRYPSPVTLNRTGRPLDLRLLDDLDWPTWDSIAHALQARLTDSVIDAAVRRLPPAYYAQDGPRLAGALEARRDRLPDAARRFYQMLAFAAEVHATDADETVTATRGPGGTLDLTIRAREGDAGDVEYFHRRFDPHDTKEVRLLLRAGDDTVRVVGAGGGPTLRVIGGAGDKVVLDDAEGGRTRVYTDSSLVTVGGSHPPSVTRRPYAPPDSTSPIRAAPRDFGHAWTFRPQGGAGSDIGVFLGAQTTLFDYGFRRNPYALRLDMRGGYSTGFSAFVGEILADLWRENSRTHFLFQARGSGIDVLRFYGFGNETADTGATTFYRAYVHQYLLSAAIGMSVGRHLTLRAGPVLKYSTTDLTRPTLISQLQPYGSGGIAWAGVQGTIAFDSRDLVAAPTRGAHVSLGGSWYPDDLGLTSSFGEVHGEASTYLTARLPLESTLALRVGGKKVWGLHPFQEGAFLGGSTTVRGLYRDRFLGDASAYANAELR